MIVGVLSVQKKCVATTLPYATCIRIIWRHCLPGGKRREPGGNSGRSMQAKETVQNAYHFVGSCGIGRVVDEDLKVKGFNNLRVVDASVIPDMPDNSGPAGTTYMLAEYMAETLIAEKAGTEPVRGGGEYSDAVL